MRTCRHETARGPAAARNRGAADASTPEVLFVDADIVVRPDTADQVQAYFDTHPDVAALFGSYDDSPGDPGLVSQYKNLTHHYTHQHASEEAFTFWAGCGAVRRDVFLSLGGFSEHYTRPCIEDIEFGYRLRQSGRRIALLKTLQVTHLKRWTLSQLVRTDLFDRGVPWMALILRRRSVTALDLNLTARAQVAVVLTWLSLGALVLGATWRPALLAGALGGGVVLALGGEYFLWLRRARGTWFALRCAPLYLLYQLYSGLAAAIGVARYVLLRGSREREVGG